MSFRIRRARLAPAIAGAASLALSHFAGGYVLEGQRWFTSSLNVVVQFPAPAFVLRDGSLDYNRSFENAMALWNAQLANFQFTWTEQPAGSPARDGDGITQVTYQSRVYGDAFDRNTLAVTLIESVGSRMTEADIVFNSAYRFNSFRGPLGGSDDMHRIALHELGHVLGLDHPDEATPAQHVTAIMNAYIGDLDDLTADDIRGAQSLYGASANAPAADTRGLLANISTRDAVGTGDAVMIGGFIIRGATKPVLIRALGPSLPLGGTLADPVLELHGPDGSLVAANNDWRDDPAQAQLISNSGVAPTNDRESAIYAQLAPGSYTAVVRGNGGTSGIALVEIYDLNQASGSLDNISTRGLIGTGDNVLIGGFIVTGPEAAGIVARAIGPSLRASLPDAIGDPTLELRNGNGELLGANNDWTQPSSNMNAVDATGLAPKDSHESALTTYLAPGNFTVIVRGNNSTTGIGLVEVYRL